MVEEGQLDWVFGVVVYAVRPGIMQEHVRRIFGSLEMKIVNSFN